MKELCADLQAEYDDLAGLVNVLAPVQWRTVTAFYGWTVWDEIAHLCYFDEVALLALKDAQAFADDAAQFGQRLARGEQPSAIARERYGHLDGAQLLSHWRACYTSLTQALSMRDAKARLPWYGPSMSARSFAAARLMETWAHGQDVYDALRRRREAGVRIRNIAHLGVTTFGWSFVNRRQPVPEPAPYVELRGPDGDLWTWNPPSTDNYVKGRAEDFCLVVTQRRHVADTTLECGGEAARQWMKTAQCFAGPPVDGPAPGVRTENADA